MNDQDASRADGSSVPACSTPVETFTAEEVQQSIRAFLIYGEEQ